ncbi:MAG: hypothetical protein AAB699_00400 [Patescibacteria group bacterium]
MAQDILRHIKSWQYEQKRLIVGIDGYSGSGKTTVLDSLAEHCTDILPLHLDEFIVHWKKRKQMMSSSMDRSKVFEYKWYRHNALCALLQMFKDGRQKSVTIRTYDFKLNDFGDRKILPLTKDTLVIEGIFLFHPSLPINACLDKRVYLSVDFESADRRRIAREKKLWGRAYMQESHPDSYVAPFKIAYRRYVGEFDPAGMADVVYSS